MTTVNEEDDGRVSQLERGKIMRRGGPHSSTHIKRSARWKKTNKDKHARTHKQYSGYHAAAGSALPIPRNYDVGDGYTQARDARSVANRRAVKKENRRGYTATQMHAASTDETKGTTTGAENRNYSSGRL